MEAPWLTDASLWPLVPTRASDFDLAGSNSQNSKVQGTETWRVASPSWVVLLGALSDTLSEALIDTMASNGDAIAGYASQ
jgi:hypothetical protein